MNIAIVTAGALPVPNTKGGGVETLVQHFIDANEKYSQYKITLFSTYDEQSYDTAKKYKNTKFIFVRKNDFLDKILQRLFCYIYAINRRTFKIKSIQYVDCYVKQVAKYISRNQDFEKIIIESKMSAIQPISKVFNGNILYHSHYDDTNIFNTKFENKRHEFILKKCKKVIAISNFIKKQIEDATNLDNIITLKNCIDIDKFSNLDKHKIKQYKSLYNLKENEIVIMYSGRVIVEKGVKELILAFKNIKSDLNVKLMIVGGAFYNSNEKSDYIKELEKLAEDIKERVIFTGYVKYDDMPYIWSLCDIGVVPTLFVEEAAGLVVIEIMASGKPLIITDSGGITEYANFDCSILVRRDELFISKLTDVLNDLLGNSQLMISMGANGIKQAEKFNVDNYYMNFSNIINSSI